MTAIALTYSAAEPQTERGADRLYPCSSGGLMWRNESSSATS